MSGSWYTVSSGQTINAADLNQFSNALHVGTGGTEVGDFFIAGQTQASGDVLSNWIVTLNHQNAPSTVGLSVVSSLNMQATYPQPNNYKPTGFQLYGRAAGANQNTNATGTYTATY